MKIGMLGTGDVGRALGNAFAATGHEVKMGSREAASGNAAAWIKQAGGRASAGTFSDAVKFADITGIATAWSGTESALRMAGLENFAGKVVIAVHPSAPWATPIREASGCSAGCPRRESSKAFNTVG